jgi:hypothetical protein
MKTSISIMIVGMFIGCLLGCGEDPAARQAAEASATFWFWISIVAGIIAFITGVAIGSDDGS